MCDSSWCSLYKTAGRFFDCTVSHADSLMVPLFLCDMLWLDPDFRNPPDVDEPTIKFCLGGTTSGLVGIGIRCSSPYLLRDRVFGWRSVIGTSLHAHVMFRAVLTQLHNRECRPRPIADSAPRRSHASYYDPTNVNTQDRMTSAPACPVA
jgi:hypothetical protein